MLGDWVGGGSARKTGSRWVTSALSTSSKPPCGISSLNVDKLGAGSASVHLCGGVWC
uniref:Uncharacterized protein n=1 Tax=Arundo donax TaxID=35708 RepID=A0A0A9C4S6_ARUDO